LLIYHLILGARLSWESSDCFGFSSGRLEQF
jgi:hypothetical protein